MPLRLNLIFLCILASLTLFFSLFLLSFCFLAKALCCLRSFLRFCLSNLEFSITVPSDITAKVLIEPDSGGGEGAVSEEGARGAREDRRDRDREREERGRGQEREGDSAQWVTMVGNN